MEKDKIQPYNGHRNQLNRRKFSDYGVAIGHHKRHRDQKSDNLSLIDLACQLLNLFYWVGFQLFRSLTAQSSSE